MSPMKPAPDDRHALAHRRALRAAQAVALGLFALGAGSSASAGPDAPAEAAVATWRARMVNGRRSSAVLVRAFGGTARAEAEPELAALGLDATGAWRDRRRASA